MKLEFVVEKSTAYILYAGKEYPDWYSFLREHIKEVLGAPERASFYFDIESDSVIITGNGIGSTYVDLGLFIDHKYVRNKEMMTMYIKNTLLMMRNWFEELTTYKELIEI